jgi:hypothetical protein
LRIATLTNKDLMEVNGRRRALSDYHQSIVRLMDVVSRIHYSCIQQAPRFRGLPCH